MDQGRTDRAKHYCKCLLRLLRKARNVCSPARRASAV